MLTPSQATHDDCDDFIPCPYVHQRVARLDRTASGATRRGVAAYQYLQALYHPKLGGFTIHRSYGQGSKGVDILNTAHLGLTALYFGDLEKAESSGRLLKQVAALQPALGSGFHLRLNDDGTVMANLLRDKTYADLATSIADYFLSNQDRSGPWPADQPAHTCFDQTEEIAI